MNLGKIKKVPLREIWKHEATNFTNWLSKSENLDLLSDEINIDSKVIQTYESGKAIPDNKLMIKLSLICCQS